MPLPPCAPALQELDILSAMLPPAATTAHAFGGDGSHAAALAAEGGEVACAACRCVQRMAHAMQPDELEPRVALDLLPGDLNENENEKGCAWGVRVGARGEREGGGCALVCVGGPWHGCARAAAAGLLPALCPDWGLAARVGTAGARCQLLLPCVGALCCEWGLPARPCPHARVLRADAAGCWWAELGACSSTHTCPPPCP